MPRRKKDGACAYCGGPGGTEDHVFSKKILLRGSHAMVVAACRACNEEKAKYDLYLRDFLGLHIELHEVPELQFLRSDAIESASKETHIRPARAILATYKRHYGWTKTGDWGVVALKTVADGDKLRESFMWIVRGMWAYHQKTVLTLEDFACDGFPPGRNLPALRDLWPEFDERTAHAVGNSVRYRLEPYDTAPPSGTCLIWLYGRLLFQLRFNVLAMERTAIAAGIPWPSELSSHHEATAHGTTLGSSPPTSLATT